MKFKRKKLNAVIIFGQKKSMSTNHGLCLSNFHLDLEHISGGQCTMIFEVTDICLQKYPKFTQSMAKPHRNFYEI